MSRLFINKSFHRNGKKANTGLNVSANNNTIYEEESPLQERNRLNHTVCGAPIKSPHSKFYRNNSNPETILCAATVQETQKKVEDSRQQKSLGKFLRYIRPNSRKKKSPPSDDASFKQHEINSSSLLSDELDASLKILPSPTQTFPDQIYEQSINKHGDVVEYAVPYSELPIKVIDENDFNETKWSGHDINALGVVSPVKVTDLDKSSDGSRSLDQSGKNAQFIGKPKKKKFTSNAFLFLGKGIVNCNNKEVFSELDSLERWSQNIPQRSLPPQEPPINKVSSSFHLAKIFSFKVNVICLSIFIFRTSTSSNANRKRSNRS